MKAETHIFYPPRITSTLDSNRLRKTVTGIRKRGFIAAEKAAEWRRLYRMAIDKLEKRRQPGLTSIRSKTALDVGRRLVGFQGYKGKPERNFSDNYLRENLTARVSKMSDTAKTLLEKFIEGQVLTAWAEMNNFITACEDLLRNLKKPKYGYTTFFDAIEIRGIDLGKLYALDYRVLQYLNRAERATGVFERRVEAGRLGDVQPRIQKITALIRDIEDTFDRKVQLIASYRKLPG